MVALQMALDAPDAVHSLVLQESARPGVPDAPQEAEFARTVFVPAVQRFQSGDPEGAIDLWMQGVAGPNYRADIESALPGTFTESFADADTFFGQQLPAVREWSLTQADAARISQPVLLVLGEYSNTITPTFGPRQALLLDWLPNAEGVILPGAGHLLHIQQPRGMAEAMVSFLSRHPIETST
jgi:3-oxoadipate enol-lactonase